MPEGRKVDLDRLAAKPGKTLAGLLIEFGAFAHSEAFDIRRCDTAEPKDLANAGGAGSWRGAAVGVFGVKSLDDTEDSVAVLNSVAEDRNAIDRRAVGDQPA